MPGAGPWSVVNVMSGPNVVPFLLFATRRTWYSAFGTRPVDGRRHEVVGEVASRAGVRVEFV